MCTCLHVTRGCLVQSLSQRSRYPFRAARTRVFLSHGQPFARAHFSTSRWPPLAACAHVSPSQGKFAARNVLNASSCPLLAAAAQTSVRSSLLRRPRECLSFSKLTYPSSAASSFETSFLSHALSRPRRRACRGSPREADQDPRVPASWSVRGSRSSRRGGVCRTWSRQRRGRARQSCRHRRACRECARRVRRRCAEVACEGK